MNAFTREYLKGVNPLRVDGERGFATNRRILTVKYYLGYSKYLKSAAHPGGRDSTWRPITVRRLRHPRSLKFSSAKMLATAYFRRRRQRRRYEESLNNVTSGVGYFDGRQVANWMIPYLKWARANGWQGSVNSGWRSPQYSQQLCYAMCGAPSCPGKCAGLASNHVGSEKPRGAVDVSDYYRFGQLMTRCPYSPRIFNGLGSRDPVHFSASGN
jgi:hypothetical protein